MSEKEWFTQREIADMLGIDIKRINAIVLTLRRVGAIQTTTDPTDERIKLVHVSGIDAIKKALRIDGASNMTA